MGLSLPNLQAALTEADTCRTYVLPKLYGAGWTDDQISEQYAFTDGRIVVIGSEARRRPRRRTDYILRYRPDYPIAVVEAKPLYKLPADGLQQAKQYAEILGLSFAYATNGEGIIEHDYLTGRQREVDGFPTPEELWRRVQGQRGLSEQAAARVLAPYYHLSGKSPRYYQEIAINRAVEAIVQGKRRVLLTLATGTGKTVVAFQICWKLWTTRWNRTREHRRPRMLYLADRTFLVDGPKDKIFAPFGDARWKIEGETVKSREMYFATYQAIARDERRPGLYREYGPGFFDLVIVDECHRGSARDESNWREILEYFEPAYQLGMTATPLREENKDTYVYFGNPVYAYSLRQGIEDGFLAPYRVHRVITTVDAAGWRPSKGESDRYGREIPDDEYTTPDFERIVALRARTRAIATHLTEFLKRTDRFAKTIVFCVDQEHALEMQAALAEFNADLVKKCPDYVCRVTADEGEIGRGHLSNFQELERETPTILTTSQLLTTGVDVPTCRNVVLARVIRSMVDFKQIIGRGTRVREDMDKLYFSILDYTGSATTLFADPDFDGWPVEVTQAEIDAAGRVIADTETTFLPETDAAQTDGIAEVPDAPSLPPGAVKRLSRFYVDRGWVEIAAHLVYELDAAGKQLRVIRFTDYTGERVRTLYPSADELRSKWSDAEQRAEVLEALSTYGISLEELAEVTKQPDADPFDLLCHLAYNAPLRTRRERAERVRRNHQDVFDRHSPEARQVLNEILDKYEQHGVGEFKLPDVLQVSPISSHGNVLEIAKLFGGPGELKAAVVQLQTLVYAA